MKRFMITIDGGTTNTRISLWNQKGELTDLIEATIGVGRAAIEGHNGVLKEVIKENVRRIKEKNFLVWEQIACIYACGMLTSDVGLVDIPHLMVLVRKQDLVNGIVKMDLEEICPIPISFVPGVKNREGMVELSDADEMDIMRGEEMEIIALFHQYPSNEARLFVLPGSHTKFVSVTGEGAITGCLTSLAGELLSVLTGNTILADSVKEKMVEGKCREDYLLAGYYAAKSTGLGRAAFLTRVISKFSGATPQDCANYLLGVVLEGDIEAVSKSRALKISRSSQIIIGGKEPLVSALRLLLNEDGTFGQIITVCPNEKKPLSGYGMFLLAREKGDF